MTQLELYQVLKSFGMPVAYSHFEDTKESPAPFPPYITYKYSSDSDFKADNQNYLDIGNFQVELYTLKKDIQKEELIQDGFKELKIPYSKTETYIASEKCMQVVYEIQLIGG